MPTSVFVALWVAILHLPMNTAAPKDQPQSLTGRIDSLLRAAIATVLEDPSADVDPLIRASSNPDHGDFQANVAMSLAKKLGQKPRDLAEAIVAATELGELAEPMEVAGPGFINITLKPSAIATQLEAMSNENLGVISDDDAHPIVIDLCSVNVAKTLHVGHLRSTIIGDALARVLERLGRTVLRENHLGDWGLPIALVLDRLRKDSVDLDQLQLEDLDHAYRIAQQAIKADPRGLDVARQRALSHRVAELEAQQRGADEALDSAKQVLIGLQQGDPELVSQWEKLIDCTMRSVYEMLDSLGSKLGPEHNRGESFYRDLLASTVETFESAGVAKANQGALVVAFEDRERPLLIRKSDGGFLYATTDLAAIDHRVHVLGADRLLYVVDARQRDHFRDVFDAARLIGWDKTADGHKVEFSHVAFGSVLGKDKKPLKTRSGDNISLSSLLNEAMSRGQAEVHRRAADPKSPTHGLEESLLDATGAAIGIGAVKYADLSNDLLRDYVFDMDRMISFEGNTGPYLQYAHARVCSIFARSDGSPFEDQPLMLDEPEERALGLMLLAYGPVITDVAASLEPHRLCQYLYRLSESYNSFYQQCPVLKTEDPAVRKSRLRLCDLVRRVLADGLDLLGIEAPQRM